MFDRPSAGSRRVGTALFVLLTSCATAHEATLPDEADLPTAGAGNAGKAGAPTGMAGTAAAGKNSGSSGAPSTAGAPSGSSGGAGASSAGSHSGGSAGSGAGGGSAGSHAGGSSAGSSAGGSAGAGTAGGGNAGASGASGSVLFSDDFEDGNSNGWTTSNGTWAIATDGSKVYGQTGTGTASTVLMSRAGSMTWANQIIEAKVKVKAFGGSSTSYFAAIYGRSNGTDYYALALRQDGKIAIRKNTTTLGSAVAAGIAEGIWYTVRLEIVGSTLKAYVNGVLTDTESDTSLAAGGIAVGTVNTTAEFDDVKVTAP
jgi:hypothetical protein